LFLSAGVLLLAFQTESFTLSGIISKLSNVPQITLVSGLCIITAAIIQSAIYPFHRWLLSAMTSPTPASALMHAGFVNGSGILLLFSTVLFASNTLIILFGGLTAVIAQFTKLLQVNVKKISLFHHCPNGFHDYAVWFGFSMRPSFTYYFMGFIKPTYFYLQERK
jgi:NAD(P)H-quinone oxidoreductase subunit 5